jgi:putative NIF3 family GTP cyclohydrolase 1 type 2
MNMGHLSRRQFAAAAGGGALLAPSVIAQQTKAVTAADIVERIRANVGVDWKSDTVDTFKAGDPATAVKGITVASMATMDVLKKAAAAGSNFIITAEPTFFGKADSPNPAPGRGRGGQPVNTPPDQVLTAKKEFIEKNGLVIWRFSDHWRMRKPDPLIQGLSETMGWTKNQTSGDPSHFVLQAMSLDALAGAVKSKVGIRGGMRVVGDPASEIRTVGLLPGTTALAAALKMLPNVDAIIAGEVREWESVEYAQDTVTAGMRKALILTGRIMSEEPGMKLCGSWLKTLVPETKVEWIATGDPYWRPV